MNYFYFNECLPSQYGGCIQSVFEDTFTKFIHFGKQSELNIEKGVVTHIDPSNITICGQISLKQLIIGCKKEIRGLASRYFTKYPIDQLYTLDEIFTEEEMDIKYLSINKDATNLIIAKKLNWFLLSLPVSSCLKIDMIIVSTTKGSEYIDNWHGDNNKYIVECIIDRDQIKEANLIKLNNLFDTRTCIVSDDFKKGFCSLPEDSQKAVLKKFIDAKNANLLFPANHDDDLVKRCKGKDNEETYELRSKSMSGARVYFSCSKDIIYIGGIGTKATAVGAEQSADISRASNEIRKLRTR